MRGCGGEVGVGGGVLEGLARAEGGGLGLVGDALQAGGPGVVEEGEGGVDLGRVLGDDLAEHAVVPWAMFFGIAPSLKSGVSNRVEPSGNSRRSSLGLLKSKAVAVQATSMAMRVATRP